MEGEQKLSNGFKSDGNESSFEKKCSKCRFSSFSLRTLYFHQLRCRGTLLSSMTCCHCKRAFIHLVLFLQHKRTCLKNMQMKKTSKKNFIKNRLKSLVICRKTGKNHKKEKTASSMPSLTRSESQTSPIKGPSSNCSARKSLPNAGLKAPVLKAIPNVPSSSESGSTNDVLQLPNKEATPSVEKEGVSCKWCKNVYPNQNVLAKHLERNSSCASAHYKQGKKVKKPIELTARKSMQHSARKSFSNHKQKIPRFDPRSARKSLPGSSRNPYQADPLPLTFLNQCPVCYQKIPDPFRFFQHQKKLNHWGRATKSMNSVCKCPFCSKKFFHVRSLHAHARNHANKSDKEIETFLKKTTCAICAQIFGSEVAKYQHMRFFHSKSASRTSTQNLDASSYSLLPLEMKKKLRSHPNKCPVCSKEFQTTRSRNEHFVEYHLDAKLKCKFCPEKFSIAESMENHMQETHYDEFQFECLACDIYLATSSHVVLHCTKVHSGENPKSLIRSRGGESFPEALGYELPTKEDKNELYCDICDITFQKKAGLQSHRQSKLHKDMVVKSLETMRESINELPSPKRAPKVQKKVPETLTCMECNESFKTIKDFVPHRLSHFAGGKYKAINYSNKYTCEICGEVCNTHSKVQMHLFWHLQVDSTAFHTPKKDKRKTDRPIGQAVAKKSFGKVSDAQQAIVIGGKKSSLFTCENCNVSFTSEKHLSLHVRKLCKKKDADKKSELLNTAGSSRMILSQAIVEKANIRYCFKCTTLYDSAVRDAHEEFCNKCARKRMEVKKNTVELLKSGMVRQNKVACCLPCSQLFGNPKSFTDHMLSGHISDNNKASSEQKNTVFCTICNCLFLTAAGQKRHESFCKTASYHDFDADSSGEILKSFSNIKGVLAVCISCNEVFTSIQTLKEHSLSHTSKPSKTKPALTNGPSTNDDVMLTDDDSIETAGSKVSNALNSASNVSLDQINEVSSTANLEERDENASDDEPFSDLRENFSQLFCILMNDSQLIKTLGFGDMPVEDFLIKVLQQMGQVPITLEEEESDIERFRKNIKVFLDFCLKDQVLELIESGTTSVDGIVVEALKKFVEEEEESLREDIIIACS